MPLYLGSQPFDKVAVKVDTTLQSKYTKPSDTTQTIIPDSDYDGLGEVIVEAMKLQAKTVTPNSSSQIVTSDSTYDGLSSVTVGAIPSSYVQPSGTRSITSNGTYDVKNYANATVNVASSGTGTMWSGKVTTQYTTYTVYYCTGQSVSSFELTGTQNISVPNHSMIVVYSGWGPISTRTKTNVAEVTSAVDGEYCGCQSGLAVYKVTGNNFTLGFY